MQLFTPTPKGYRNHIGKVPGLRGAVEDLLQRCDVATDPVEVRMYDEAAQQDFWELTHGAELAQQRADERSSAIEALRAKYLDADALGAVLRSVNTARLWARSAGVDERSVTLLDVVCGEVTAALLADEIDG